MRDWTRISIMCVLALGGAAPGSPERRRPEGTIQLVGRMRIGRAAATVSTISNDRVLIAGGMVDGGSALREFEVFDATTRRVVAAGDMREARIGHSATTLSDGRVLILGGFNGSYLKTAELFDPRTGRFAAAGSMNVGRSGHTATLLGDGTVLITGGVGDGWSFLSSAETYDPANGRFTLVKPLSVARESHTATLLRDGKVMIAGGHRDRRESIVIYASTEIYDPSQRQFAAGPALTIARHKHEAAALADGRVLVFGGSDPRDRTRYSSAEVYDPGANRWVAISPMATARYKLRDTALRLRDDRILIAGSGRFAEVFDPRTNAFTRVAGEFGQDYSFASATLLGDGDALVLCGYDDAMHHTAGIWRFHP